ncbi:putative membrane protein [Escherichia coli 2-316-03_S4_C2]|nr:putative membrane protein [Escherichia coli 2-316-03_S4_C2]
MESLPNSASDFSLFFISLVTFMPYPEYFSVKFIKSSR